MLMFFLKLIPRQLSTFLSLSRRFPKPLPNGVVVVCVVQLLCRKSLGTAQMPRHKSLGCEEMSATGRTARLTAEAELTTMKPYQTSCALSLGTAQQVLFV